MPRGDSNGNGGEVVFPGDAAYLSGLREARKQAGLSKAQLARLAQVPVDEVTRLENLSQRALIVSARRIAQALGVSLNDLVTAEQPRTERRHLPDLTRTEATAEPAARQSASQGRMRARNGEGQTDERRAC